MIYFSNDSFTSTRLNFFCLDFEQWRIFGIFFLAQNRKIFAEQDAERAMVFLLLSENDEVRVAACQALAVMAESMLSRETIRNNGQ